MQETLSDHEPVPLVGEKRGHDDDGDPLLATGIGTQTRLELEMKIKMKMKMEPEQSLRRKKKNLVEVEESGRNTRDPLADSVPWVS